MATDRCVKPLSAWASALMVMLLLAAGPSWAGHPADVALRGYDGAPLVEGNTSPYSPKETCGACHDYQRIAGNYHVQQGWNELFTAEEKEGKPWLHSPGMAGKW